jgi:quinol monooxygenase YgiN
MTAADAEQADADADVDEAEPKQAEVLHSAGEAWRTRARTSKRCSHPRRKQNPSERLCSVPVGLLGRAGSVTCGVAQGGAPQSQRPSPDRKRERRRMKLGLPSAALPLFMLAIAGCARGPIAGGPPLGTRPPIVAPAQSAEMQSASEPRLRLPEQASAHTLVAEAEVPAEPTYDMAFSEADIERDNNDAMVEVPEGPVPLYGAIVLQKVDNYSSWRASFDERLDARKRAGFVAQGIMRGVDDPKLVAVWLAVTDLPLARAYLSARTAVPKKQRGGASKPRVQLSSNVVAHLEPGRKGLNAAIVTLHVKELAVFKAAFDAQAAVRHEAGVVGYALSQDVDDEHLVYLYLQGEASTALKAYVAARTTKAGWRDAGVESVGGVTMVRETELTLCH